MSDKPKSKRRVKNPESFREQAIKASESSGQPSRRSKLGQSFNRFLGPVFRPAGKGLKRVAKFKPVAILLKGLKLIGKIIFPSYFRNSWRELRLVTWPNWQQSRQLTFAVLVFAVVFGATIALVDYGLDKVFKNILLK